MAIRWLLRQQFISYRRELSIAFHKVTARFRQADIAIFHEFWFPLWLGYFSRVDDLPNLLNEQVQDPIPAHHRRRFAEEFWYKADGQAGERVVEFVADYVQDWGTSKRVYTICTAPPRRFKKKLTSTVKHVWRSLR